MHLNMLRMVSDLRVASDFLPESVFIVYGFLYCREEKAYMMPHLMENFLNLTCL